MPIGLAENRHAKAFALQQPAEQRHGEARMIDVRVAGDKHHVDRVPTACGHFGRRHRQRRGRSTGQRRAVSGGHATRLGDIRPLDDRQTDQPRGSRRLGRHCILGGRKNSWPSFSKTNGRRGSWHLAAVL